MAITLEEAIEDMRGARGFFNRHATGMTPEQWDAKPFAPAKSVREIFVHLLATNRASQDMLNGEPFEFTRHTERHKEASAEIASLSPTEIIALHDAEGEALIALARQKCAGGDLDTPVTLWGQEGKLGIHLGHLNQELAYHTGQVSLLRQALAPDWDYFGDVFGAPSS